VHRGPALHPLLNWLHHDFGLTHVVHHLASDIPHYQARAATVALDLALLSFRHGQVSREVDQRSALAAIWELSLANFHVRGLVGVQALLPRGAA
jgi:fatty acid desaturase